MKPNQIPLLLNRNPRNAFTLVELMVAMALIILMLSIMSQAFVIATGVMQGLKEVADMQEKIRPAITLLQRDLGANHFEGSKKLSDPEFWDNGPPKEGYFMLWQDKANEPASGVEPSGDELSFNGVSFSRSAALANHMLAFTVKLPGKSPNEFFESSLGADFPDLFYNTTNTPLGMKDANIRRYESNANLIHSDWAEVAYFLGPHDATNVNYPSPTPDGYTDGKSGPALPYYNLYRQQRMVLPSYNVAGVTLPGIIQNSQISYEMGTPSFNKPSDLTVPWKRSMGNRTNISNTPGALTANHYLGKPNSTRTPTPRLLPLFTEYIGSTTANTDIIATNVISFDVKLLTDDQYDYETLNVILNRAPYSLNLNPAVGNYSPSLVFDTWTTDQGSSTLSFPKYDLGEWNTIPNKWQPSFPASIATIPVWGWKWDVVNNSNRPYKGIQIKAVQISLRIWDQKSNTAKMFVIIQKL